MGGDIEKADNGTSLVNGSSWTGGVAPSATDVALFNDVYTLTGTLGTGAGLDYQGLKVEGTTVTDLITVNNTTYANYVGTGMDGIVMTTAPRDLRIVGYVALDNQTWDLAAGRTLTLGGTRFSGTGNINITGSGSVVINDGGADDLTGNLTVSGGTLVLNSDNVDGDIIVNDGAVLDSEQVLLGDLALGSSTGATLLIDPTTAGSIYPFDLSLAGTNTISVSQPVSSPGVVDVLKYDTLSAGGLANLQVDPVLASSYRNAPTLSDTGVEIQLEFHAGSDLTWTGATDGNWDVNTTANWDDSGATNFLLLDSATFDDTAATFAVNVDGVVSVQGITFSNPVNDYTISGGTLTVGDDISAAGTATISSPVVSGQPLTVTAAAGETIKFGGTINALGNELTIDGDGTVELNDGGSANQISNGAGIVKNGSGTLIMSGRNTGSGDVVVNEGKVVFQSNNWLEPNFGGDLYVNAGAVAEPSGQVFGFYGRNFHVTDGTLTFTGTNYTRSGTSTLDGATLNTTNSGMVLRMRATTLITGDSPSHIDLPEVQSYGAITWDVEDVTGDEAVDLVLTASGNNGLHDDGNKVITKNGVGTMELNGVTKLDGATSGFDVNAGTMIVNSSAASGDVAVWNFADGTTLGGEGDIGGSLTLGGGGSASLMMDASTPGAFDVGGDLTLDATAGNIVVSLGGTIPHTDGPITVLTYGGTLTGDPATLMSLDPADAANFRSAVFADTGSSITLELGSIDLVWDAGVWDYQNDSNWNSGANDFYWGDTVTFDDTASSGWVAIDDSLGVIAPLGVEVNNSSVAYTFTGDAITGGGSLTKSGTGSLALANTANTYTGGTIIDGGSLVLDASDLLPVGGDLTVTSPGVFDMAGFNQTLGVLSGDGTVLTGGGMLSVAGGNYAGVISGTGSLSLLAGGTLVVSGANDYSGGTLIETGGLLQVDDGGALGTGGVVNHGQLVYALSTDVTVSGIFGSGSLAQSGTATMFIPDDSNVYTGNTVVNSGTLHIGNGSTSGSIPGGLVNNGVTIFDRSDTISLPGVTGGGDMIQMGSGNLDVNGTTTSNSSSDYINWFFNGGTVTVSGRAELHDGGIGAAAPVFHFDGGELAFDAWPDGSVGAYKRVELNAGGGTLAPVSGVSVEFDGNVFGSGSFTKTGDGTIVLSSAGSNYSGDTTVDAGVLELSNEILDDVATVNLDGTGVLNLTHAGTDLIGVLKFDGVEQAAGTWGGVGSSADHETPRITGSGWLEVLPDNDYDTWATDNGYWTLGDPNSGPTEDFDGDGVSNEDEYAFGLDPTDAASVNPITQMVDPATGVFRYTRRDPALSGWSYLIETSPDLSTWTEDAGASENIIGTVDGVQTVEVTLSAALLLNTELFLRAEGTAPTP